VIALLQYYAPTWLAQMPAVLTESEFEAVQRRALGATRERMLREFAEAVEVLTAERALVLVVEDLHWSDVSTVELLAVLARRREPARLLVIGTYRPVDAILQAHPLRAMLQELQAHRQCEEVAVAHLRDAAVARYLDVRFPVHHFPPSLPRLISQRTNGNPLFLVHTVSALVHRGAIGEHEGRWRLQAPAQEVVVGVPESVRQLIEQQLERLSEEERHLLEVASVAGADFSAAILAADGTEVQVGEEGCERLAQRGQFLAERGVAQWPDGTVATRYGFLHALYQSVLYEQLPDGRRMRLHREVGSRLARGYGERAWEIASELANHFERGREPQRAAQYHGHAAQTALQRSALPEAIAHVHRGLALLATLPDAPERTQQELSLQLTLGLASITAKGVGAPEVGRAFARARELSQQVDDSPHHFPVLLGLAIFYNARAEFRTALTLAEHCLRLAEQTRDSGLLLAAHYSVGMNLHPLGDLPAARRHYEHALELHDSPHHRPPAFLPGQDPGINVKGLFSWLLWHLGYPEQALRESHHACTLAYDLGHANMLAGVLTIRAVCHVLCGKLAFAQAYTDETITYASVQNAPAFLATATICRGWIHVAQGQWEGGMALLRKGLADYEATGTRVFSSWHLVLFIDACRAAGRIDEGLAALTEAFTFVEQTGERVYEAELYRLKGELLLSAERGM
jgi:predicted ATPase